MPLKLGNKITAIKKVSLESFEVQLLFNNKKSLTISLSHIFDSPKGLAAEVLRGGVFEQCFLEHGALAWPNGLEFCPDFLFQLGHQQIKNSAA